MPPHYFMVPFSCCTSITVMKIKPVKTARESNRSWASAPGAGWWVWNSPRPFVFLFSEFHCAVRKNNVEMKSKMFGFVPGQTLANHDFRDPWMANNPGHVHKKLYFRVVNCEGLKDSRSNKMIVCQHHHVIPTRWLQKSLNSPRPFSWLQYGMIRS